VDNGSAYMLLVCVCGPITVVEVLSYWGCFYFDFIASNSMLSQQRLMLGLDLSMSGSSPKW